MPMKKSYQKALLAGLTVAGTICIQATAHSEGTPFVINCPQYHEAACKVDMDELPINPFREVRVNTEQVLTAPSSSTVVSTEFTSQYDIL